MQSRVRYWEEMQKRITSEKVIGLYPERALL